MNRAPRLARPRLTLGAGLVLLLLPSCETRPGRQADSPATGPAAQYPLSTFAANRVAVDIALEVDSAGGRWLRAEFTPTRPHLHLYSIDLPKAGLNGIGHPTLLEVVPSPSVRPIGALRADRLPIPLVVPALGLTFPVYPDGPVTLRLPVQVADTPASTVLSVTYTACSDRTCFPPVIDRHIAVNLPATGSRSAAR